MEANLQYRFAANVWCRVIEGQIMGPYIMEGRVTRSLCRGEVRYHVPDLLECVRWEARAGMYSCACSTTDHQHYPNYRCPVLWIDRGGSQNWPPQSPDLNLVDLRVCEYGRGPF